MDRLDLNPPAALLKSQSDDIRVISVANDELVAVLDIGVLEWDLANRTLEDICVSTLALLEALLSRFLVRLELQCVQLMREMLGYLVLQL